MAGASMDHGYSLATLQQACDDEDIEWLDQQAEENTCLKQPNDPQTSRHHTPLKSPKPKKSKTADLEREVSNSMLLNAIHNLARKFDIQGESIQAFEWQLKENTDAVVKIKESVDTNTSALKEIIEDVNKLKTRMTALQKENMELKDRCLEHARYKRNWSLRLNGLPEKDGENVREEVIKIVAEIVPMSTQQLQNTVDTVHRLGQKTKTDRPRQIIIQIGMRIVRDQVWKMSKNSKICNDRKIRFREDFCKEDREAHTRLWPKVEEARMKGLEAFLRDGCAFINGRRVTN